MPSCFNCKKFIWRTSKRTLSGSGSGKIGGVGNACRVDKISAGAFVSGINKLAPTSAPTDRSTWYTSPAIAGPITNRKFSNWLPCFKKWSTALGTMRWAVPRQPAWIAETLPVRISPIKTGVQSALATQTACWGWSLSTASAGGKTSSDSPWLMTWWISVGVKTRSPWTCLTR